MAGSLARMERMLKAQLGDELLSRCPELIYAVNRTALCFLHASDSPVALWRKIDSTLFNAVYTATGGAMTIEAAGGKIVRITERELTDLADRLLSTVYEGKEVTPSLQDALFDLSRSGSFAAMRELLARFPLDDTEREILSQILRENGQSA